MFFTIVKPNQLALNLLLDSIFFKSTQESFCSKIINSIKNYHHVSTAPGHQQELKINDQ